MTWVVCFVVGILQQTEAVHRPHVDQFSKCHILRWFGGIVWHTLKGQRGHREREHLLYFVGEKISSR
jgi:hypothetical protein